MNIGVLISGSGTNLQAVIDACEDGRIKAAISFVGSDNPDAKGLERAKRHGIATFVVDYESIKGKQQPVPSDCNIDDIIEKQRLFHSGTDKKKLIERLSSRIAAEKQLLDNINRYPFDLLILAGFMRKLTPYFIDRINTTPLKPRIMNIHPALLPSFPGVDGYGDTYRYGCKIGGCTVHFVDYGEDTGPIIGQKAFSILSEDTLESVKEKGLKLEWDLYVECIRLFTENRLKIIESVNKTKTTMKVIEVKI